MKILVSTGIRSDYDILYPVMSELRENDHELQVVISGAHLSDLHNNTWERVKSDGFRVADKIDTLLSTDRLVQRAKGVGLLIQGLTQTVEREKPDFIIVLGDREESIATAIVGNYMNILVMHIGGGDPVYGNADDPVRFAVSKLAHLHCCTAKAYARNLEKVGEEPFRIFFTGNPAYINIDNESHIKKNLVMKRIGLSSEDYIVLIKHPLSSEKEDASFQMKQTMEALRSFCNMHNYQVVCIPPNSDPGSFAMKQVLKEYIGEKWIVLAPTINRNLFVNLMRGARALIGNSSMGILEAPHYKLPVVNVGNRQKGRLNAGNVEFVGYDEGQIIDSVSKACFDEKYRLSLTTLENPYGNSRAAINVREALESVDLKDPKWYIKRRLC